MTELGVQTDKSAEVHKLIEEFRSYLTSDEGKHHISYLKEKEPKEVKDILGQLKNLKSGPEFVELVLYGLLPHSQTKFAKRISLSPAFMNIKKFFTRFNYTDQDWTELASLVFKIVDRFQQDPNDLENAIREFISHRLSKGIQCGSLSPVFFALNPGYPIVNNREIRAYRKLSYLVFDKEDELSQRLENYISNVSKIKNLVRAFSADYKFQEISNMAVFDLFCYWYDQYKMSTKKSPKYKTEITEDEKQKVIDMLRQGLSQSEIKKATLIHHRTIRPIRAELIEKGEIVSTKSRSKILTDELRKNVNPIEERHVGKFFQSLACSEPQPYFVAMGDTRNLQKLDAENRIIYNTEFQRGEVWDLPRKQKLLDSMLRGYNINTIFMRQLTDGRFECLDGQQRLKTILKGFLNDKFPINPKITPEFNRETYFSELPEALKSKIKNYAIYTIIFYTENDEETCKIFLRLQEGLPLNSAEKLNARTGMFRNEIVELTKHPFVEKLGIKDYRFAHRYILSQMFLLTLRNQITDMKFRNLEEMYITYKTIKPSESITNTVKKVLNFLDRQFGEDSKIVQNNADFISLYLLGKHIIENYAVDGVSVNLNEFFKQFLSKVGEVESSEKEGDAPYYDYKTYRKTSADSRDSTEKRFNVILSKFLEFNQKLLPKDPNRNFDYWEKLAIYHQSKGVCQMCGEKILFDKGSVDHKIPHSKGGPTTLENAQWLCVTCNLKKLNKV
jgi:5-methylcytosine-specific restriction endonuclease McrA